ncbi:uncharacterized protein FIBRA_02077 [Fibroporia radiculosa]|uniref:Uncharacterized protein n=1 Tax=Fibroporia radiculosa TaxID=599839 RepID=J4I8V1_9APHY|nr:uncharacterized protein FIBRA_02077 [Fibroporia radiculosa]CCM00051.1 predicted protein [Fibroporia radiculosa]
MPVELRHSVSPKIMKEFSRLWPLPRSLQPATSFVERMNETHDLANINYAITSWDILAQLMKVTHSLHVEYLGGLATSLVLRNEHFRDVDDIAAVIVAIDEILRPVEDSDPKRLVFMHELGTLLLQHFERLADISDIDESIPAMEGLVRLTPDDHSDKCLGDPIDIDRLILVTEYVVRLTPDDHPHKASALRNFGSSLLTRFKRLGNLTDIDKAITVLDDAYDIDVLIKVGDNVNLHNLRETLSLLDAHFASAGIKFYFVQDPLNDAQGDVLKQLQMRKNNVVIETLQAGTLGLPQNPEPRFIIERDGCSIPILRPSVLILTKMKRWSHNCDSMRPKTVQKNASDKADIDFLVRWLAEYGMMIEFELYEGKSKDQLLDFVRQFRNRFAEDEELMADLKKTLNPHDWELL